MKCWDGYERVPGTLVGAKGSCRKSPVKKRTESSAKRKYYKSQKRCNISSIKRRKSKKTSVKRRKSKKTSIKRRKSKKTSIKRRKSKKKTNIQEALYLKSGPDGPLVRISPPKKPWELEITNTVDSEANSNAVRKLEILETLLEDDSRCKKYIKNPYLTLSLKEKQNLKDELVKKLNDGENLTNKEETDLEFLVDAIAADPEEVEKKKTFGTKWFEKYMSSPVEDELSQGEFWYKTIDQFVPPNYFASYSTGNVKVVQIYQNIARATNIIDSASGDDNATDKWRKLISKLCTLQENAYSILKEITDLKNEIYNLSDQINKGKLTDQRELVADRDRKENELKRQGNYLDDAYIKINNIKSELTELESQNNSLSERLMTYWETPISVLLPNSKTVKPIFATAKENDPLILSDFDSSSPDCTLNQVKNMGKTMLFEDEPSSDCSIAKKAFKLKSLATNMATDPLLIFKSVIPNQKQNGEDLPYKLTGPKFYQQQAFETLASFAVPKKINPGTQMSRGGMTKCEQLALYYFLDKLAAPADSSGIPKILEMIRSNVPITDDDIRDPESIIEEMKKNKNPDLFYRALYLTMPIPRYTDDILKIYKALEISDKQFLQYEKGIIISTATEKLKNTIDTTNIALENAKKLGENKDYTGAIETLNSPTSYLVVLTNQAVKAGVTGLVIDEAKQLYKQLVKFRESNTIKSENKKLGKPRGSSPPPPNPLGGGGDALLASIAAGQSALKKRGNAQKSVSAPPPLVQSRVSHGNGTPKSPGKRPLAKAPRK